MTWKDFIAIAKATGSGLTASAFIFLSACAKDIPAPDAAKPPIVLNALTELSYTTTVATLNITGQVQTVGVTDLTALEFHTKVDCVDSAVGQGTSRDFSGKGILLKVTSQASSPLYAKVNTATGCYPVVVYDPLHLPPSAPVFLSTSPASPSRVSSTPAIFGTPSPTTTSLNFFDDSLCTNSVGTGSAADFSTLGIPLTLQANHVSTIYTTASEPFGNKSPCTHLTDYTHDTSSPWGPTFTSMTPVSPNNTSTTPTVIGLANATDTIVNVAIFGDSACATQLARDSREIFESTGITVPVPSNKTTSLYAQSINGDGVPSFCNYLTTYIHDITPPDFPKSLSANPTSPSGATLYPKIKGTASSDTVTVALYSNAGCSVQIGAGSKALFQSTGITASVQPNALNTIYVQDVDAAGNHSTCNKAMISFVHDSIPPIPPDSGTSVPVSPNNVTNNPVIFGAVDSGDGSGDTARVNLYLDDLCKGALLGTATGTVFSDTGISVLVPSNADTQIYATSVDLAGNASDCTPFLMYQYLHATAAAPTFTKTLPASPSNVTYKPYISGGFTNTPPSALASNIVGVRFFNESSCMTTPIGSGTAHNYLLSTGIQITASANAATDIYGIATDIYGNDSDCTPTLTPLTTYVHDNIPPDSPPGYLAATPASPNNISYSPVITGTATLDTTTVTLYDSDQCITSIGTGPRADFVVGGSGIIADATPNATTSIFAKAFDLAGNATACTPLLDYRHDNIGPTQVTSLSATPHSPSYVRTTRIKGTSSADTVSVSIFTDPTCGAGFLLTSGTKATFDTTGIQITVPENASTPLYLQAYDDLLNPSLCTFFETYKHSDLGPSGLVATTNADGSIYLQWDYDDTHPNYTVKRSLWSAGPYTIISSGLTNTNFTDYLTTNGTTFYYVVTGNNITGTSKDSTPVAHTNVSVSLPAQINNLTATAGPGQIQLNWNGNSTSMTYTLYRGTQPGGPYLTAVVADLTAVTYTDPSRTNDTPYYYVVVGSNPAGKGPYSSEASAVPKAVPSAGPTGLSLIASAVGVTLNWSAPSFYNDIGAHFNIKRGYSSGGEATITSTTATTFSENFPRWGAIYYTVTSTWGSSESPASNEVGVYNSGTLPGVTATPGHNQVLLAWATLGAAIDYQILRSSTPGGPYTVLGTTGGLTYVDSGLTDGVTSYYVARARYGTNLYGLLSSEASATPGSAILATAPTNLVVSGSGGSTAALLTWSAPINYNNFNIYRASAAAGTYTKIFSNRTTSNYTDLAPLTGMNYYKVTTVWGATESTTSSYASFRNSVPTAVVATAASASVGLSWGVVSGSPSGYHVKRAITATDISSPGGVYDTFDTPTNSYTDSAIVSGTGYYYVISAYFGDGTTGQDSLQVSATPGGVTKPSGLTVIATTTNSVSLTWAAVAGATTYKVYQSTTSGVYTTAFTSSTVPNVALSGLTGGVHYFKLTASVGAVTSPYSDEISAKTVASPSTPIVKAGAVIGPPTSVDVSWTAISGATYNLERSSDGISFSPVTGGTGLAVTSFNDPTVTGGNLYFYRYLPIIAGGYSPFYSAVSAGVTPAVQPTAPGAPGVLTNNNGTDLVLSWASVPGATNYKLKKSTVSGSGYTLVPGCSLNQCTLTGLTTGTALYFIVTALNGNLESANSPELTVIPLASPTAPTVAGSGTNAVLNWTAVTGASNYEIQRSTSGDLNSFATIAGATAIVATTYTDTTAPTAVPLFYRFFAHFAADGPPVYSATSSPSITLGTQPLAPVGLTISASTTTSATLSWIPTPSVASYNLKRGLAHGGPYTNSMVSTGLTTHADTGLSGAYYYVVTSVNSSGVESANSNEVSINLAHAPTGLAAVSANKAITLTWSTGGGSPVTYTVSRSTTSGGPYGALPGGTVAGLTFTDTAVEDGVDYYYVVIANFASSVSPNTAEVHAVGISHMNLQVPIELTDQALGSDTVPLTFERTRTSLDNTNYDGTVTYTFDIVATNSDSVSHNVTVVNGAGSVFATAPITAGITAAKRFSFSMTAPTTGWDSYRLKLDGTTSFGQLSVLSARILVNQTNATKTKIYIPLLASGNSASAADAFAPIGVTTDATYAEQPGASIYQRNSGVFSTLAEYNAWELETLVAATGGETGSVALYDMTHSAVVQDTETLFSSSAVTLTNAPFDEGITGFGSANESDQYQVQIACTSGCLTGAIKLYKAGLWVTLTNLSKVEVLYRNSLAQNNVSAQTDSDGERTMIDLTKFTTPSKFFQAVVATTSSNATVQLMTDGSNDTGFAGMTPVSSSLLNFYSSPQKSWSRSGSLTLTTGNRFLPEINLSDGTANLIDASVVIQAIR